MRKAVAALAALLLVGCDPSAFVRPLQEFRAANASLRDAYFQQLRIAREAREENFAASQMATLWAGSGDPGKVAAEIAKRSNTPPLNPDSLKLRQAAFDALDGYAGVLLALASGDDTAEIIADAKGLLSDFTKLVDAAKALKGTTHFAKEVEPWLGPLGGVVDLFGTVLKLVSDAAREKALRDSIEAADEPINALLGLLAREAAYANEEARAQYALTAGEIKAIGAGSFHDRAAQREAAEYLVRLDTKAKRLGSADEVKAPFLAAEKAQAALMRKSNNRDYEKLLNEMRTFKKSVAALKSSLDAIERVR